MHTPASNTVASVIPCLRYRDAPAAIDWLCRTFGFQRKLVVPGEDGQVLHAELTYASPNGANGMLMLGSSVRDNAYGRLMRHVDEAGGNTQSLYLVVADPDALFRSAQAAGADHRGLAEGKVLAHGLVLVVASAVGTVDETWGSPTAQKATTTLGEGRTIFEI